MHVHINDIHENNIEIEIFLIPLVDSSIYFYGQALYQKENFNHWKFIFIVVKRLDALTEVSKVIGLY